MPAKIVPFFVPFWTSVGGALKEGENPGDPPIPILELTMVPGFVITRNNAGDAAGAITVDDIPSKEEVEVGDKVYCKITENEFGIATEAAIEIGTTWPTSVAPTLAGGDGSGAGGYRYVRICEIVQDAGTKPRSSRILTGHIDHFQPGFVGNILSSYTSGEGGNVLARYEDAEWKLRGLGKGSGQLTITEGADEIEIRGNSVSGENDAMVVEDGLVTEVKTFSVDDITHPFKITNGGSGNAAISAGFSHGYYMIYDEAGTSIGPDDTGGPNGPTYIVAGPSATYLGGTLAITGTKYIYAEIPRVKASLEYCQSEGSGNDIVTTKLYNEIEPGGYDGLDTVDSIVMFASDDPPPGYLPSTGITARCIGRVTNTAGVITVDQQYITHNFDMFIPTVKTLVVTNT
jgi:hypothetical protein